MQNLPTPAFVDAVDWTRPWLAPFRTLASSVLQEDWRQRINALAAQQTLRNHQDQQIRFVPQSDLPAGTAYEAFISDTGCIPTRSNLHDFFNALVWLTFPHAKKQLNALHAREILKGGLSTDGGGQPRGRLRDAATIFDENGALIVVRNHSFVDALRGHDWHQVFVNSREGYGRDWEVCLFGHALMEKLAKPYKAITAHALPLIANDEFFAMSAQEKRHWMDGVIAQRLSHDFAISELTPLPVLGVPGWWYGQDESFYRDSTVFREGRRRDHRSIK